MQKRIKTIILVRAVAAGLLILGTTIATQAIAHQCTSDYCCGCKDVGGEKCTLRGPFSADSSCRCTNKGGAACTTKQGMPSTCSHVKCGGKCANC